MQTQSSDVDVATISDAAQLATWNIQRTSEQLKDFISTRHAALPDNIELQIFCFTDMKLPKIYDLSL